ncbi:hypothetical protein T03_8773 [Trichinella britovi]|uniref:Uncharacterized protein n=1 Tax=Trichinella britovi TaxID=45882 RepID=A0A0V1CM46_TRIBR|nr:hypothetical protein T03_8773 [Trichinella britovi]
MKCNQFAEMLFNATKCVFVLQNSTNDAPREERQPNSANLFVISVTVFFSVNMLLFSPGCWFETSLKDQKCDFATVLYITFLFKVSAVVFYFCSLSACLSGPNLRSN